MKKLILLTAILLTVARMMGQSNEPVRLAVISETNAALAAADVLTAQLSGNEKLHLLERDEIEKVYREQGMSAANRDDLRLGRILGADGLLLLNIVRTPQVTNLTARLIAVKPGVVLTDGSFPWPLNDTAQWAESITAYLNAFLPKLTVLARDAVPISIVNLRAAVESADEQETERELKLLTIQRLSQERQFFVLERQKMQLLSNEKELKSDESTFWDGSYLLDGAVDQNGYSKKIVTINARLTPPKGGTPLMLEVSGSRTNLAEVVNQLAVKVTESMNVNSTVQEWNATDEASQFYDEAKWALRWGVYPEAEAAADSAWALGKQDMDCAIVRIRAYELPLHFSVYEKGEFENPSDTNEVIKTVEEEAAPNHPWGLTLREQNIDKAKDIKYVFADKYPDPENIDIAMHALDLYYQFSQNSSEGSLIQVASEKSRWKNSKWYNLGIEDLVAASTVLQNFNFVPEAQKSVADKLADLRARARSVAAWIYQTPSVRDSYFVGDRLVTHDELANTIEEQPNIFNCEVNWGCFWQEVPEDCVPLYRKLMSSPVFCYMQNDLWLRPLERPRLVAWNEEDQKRIPAVWGNFLQELNNSSNVLSRLEAKAFQLADSRDDQQLAASFTNLFDTIFDNRQVLIDNNVEVLYLDWGTGNLVNAVTGNGMTSPTMLSLNDLFDSEYYPKLETMDQEYWNKTVPAKQFVSTFEKQKQYLKENQPFDFFKFTDLFASRDFSKPEALEIQPLIVAYKSNLTAQIQNASGMQKGKLIGAMAQVQFLENDVNHILNSSASEPQQVKIQVRQPVATLATNNINEPEVATNIISVNQFFPIPLDSLYHLDDGEKLASSSVTITAHHWFGGRLFLDFKYGIGIELRDEKGILMNVRGNAGNAIAIFDPLTERWQIIDCPRSSKDEETYLISQNRFYHRSAFLHGELFTCDEGRIKKYDFQTQQWNVLSISDGNNYELFAVNGHLYAANQNIIFEITNDGNGTHVLASARRQPPMSALDAQSLGTPILFEGPNHSLRTSTGIKIYTWTNNDWREDSVAPQTDFPPEFFPDGILFRWEGSFYDLPTEAVTPKLYLSRDTPLGSATSEKPLWKVPPGISFLELPATLHQSDLYLLKNHSDVQGIANNQHVVTQEKVVRKDRWNAAILCFSSGLPLPQKLFVDFDAPDGCPPSIGIAPPNDTFPVLPPAWMLAADNFLFFGLESPKNSMDPYQADRLNIGYKAGIWLLPFSKIESVLADEKQIQNAEQQRQAAIKEQAQKNLIAKYDSNHNGLVDPDEKENALANQDFIESQMEIIDANHNGLLDAQELVYFDANTNKILDANEQTGIDIAERLLAAKWLKQFDADGNGVLNHLEFEQLRQSLPRSPFPGMAGFGFPDTNHDGQIDLDELTRFLKERTRSELIISRPANSPQSVTAPFSPMNFKPTGSTQLFKTRVERFWQNQENTNHFVGSLQPARP